jgi:hypothetical protein
MGTLEAFLLGVMAACTPSLVLLGWMLLRDMASEPQGDLHG